MAALQFPCTVFKTRKRMDDYSASDMHCGALTGAQLKTHYRPEKVSDHINPYTLTRVNKGRPFQHPRLGAYAYLSEGEKITRQQCAALLFDEFRQISRLFSVYGPYRHLIGKMITHMQQGNGTPFRDMALDRALKDGITLKKIVRVYS